MDRFQKIMGSFVFGFGVLFMIVLPWSIYDVFRDDHAASPIVQGWRIILLSVGMIVMARWIFIQYHSLIGARRQPPPKLGGATPFVSILVPAYNESATIIAALRSLIDLDYPHYEVIVVSDGSTDDTLLKARSLEGSYPQCDVKVLSKPNGGKWSALNRAYVEAQGDVILCVDADSRLSRTALLYLTARLYSDPEIVAVAGQVTVRNRERLLTRFQSLEYIVGNGGNRLAWSQLGLTLVVPGPIGMYKRAVLEQISHLAINRDSDGPLSGATFAEDMQLSISALAMGGKIAYEPRAVAYTKAPTRMDALISQRYRWMRGTFQVLRIYLRDLRGMSRTHKHGRALDWLMLLLKMDLYLLPVLNFLFYIGVGVAAATTVGLIPISMWIGGIMLLNMMTAMVYIIAQDDDLTLVPLTIFHDVYQSLLVNCAWLIAIFDEWRGVKMRWS